MDRSSVPTELVVFDEVPLIAPIIGGNSIAFPHPTWKDFPSKCGAGNGFGDLIVPESIWGLRVSPVCWIHDNDFEIAPPTWEAFHACNYRMLYNLISTIRYRSNNSVLKHIRLYRTITMFNAVNTIGKSVFWKIKKEQGCDIPS